MTDEEARIKTCQVLRKRVRYDGASLRLESTPFSGDDTARIAQATKLYCETWIVPLIDAIESGDFTVIKRYYEYEPGHPMIEKPARATGEAGT